MRNEASGGQSDDEKLVDSHLDPVRAFARSIGLQLPPGVDALLLRHANAVLEEALRINLTTIRQPTDIAVKHIADSLACLVAMDRPSWERSKVIDVGSGPGYPGLPIAAVARPAHVTLLEATSRKTAFLERVVRDCEFERVEVVCGRAEDLGRKTGHRGAYGVAVARAVAELAVLVELCLPLLQVGGLLVALKSEALDDELALATGALATVGGQVEKVVEYILPGIDRRRAVVVVRKILETPDRYPRRAGIPEKRPLR